MRLRDWADAFPLGRAPLVMIVLLVLSAPVVLTHDYYKSPDDLELWVFATTHKDEYAARLPGFEKSHPPTRVLMQEIPGGVLFDKLLACFLTGKGAPDLAEIEISAIGRFFAGAKDDIGFIDLRPYLERDGLYDEMVVARFSPWSNRGAIYGVPHDIHPVVMIYRRDVLEPFGDPAESIDTWADFVDYFEQPGVLDTDGDGEPDRDALLVDTISSATFLPLLLQRGGGFFYSDGHVTFDSDEAVEVAQFLYDLVHVHRIASPSPGNRPEVYGLLREKRVLCRIAPDWDIGFIKKETPDLAGKWSAMPLPASAPEGRRTSTLGGTMMAITKQCRDPDGAWELIRYLYFDPEALVNRYDKTRIIPPMKAAWRFPVYAEPDPFFDGQKIGLLLVSLADQVPPRYSSWLASQAEAEIGRALYAIMHNHAPVRETLKRHADILRERQATNRFAGLE